MGCLEISLFPKTLKYLFLLKKKKKKKLENYRYYVNNIFEALCDQEQDLSLFSFVLFVEKRINQLFFC